MSKFGHFLCCAVMGAAIPVASGSAITIDFHDPVTVQGPMVYGSVESQFSYTIPSADLDVTFKGFESSGPDMFAYLGIGGNSTEHAYGVADNAVIEFSKPVFVSSLWISNPIGNWDGYMFTVDGFMAAVDGDDPVPAFPSTYDSALLRPESIYDEFFWELTGTDTYQFADYPITELRFSSFQEVLLDNLTFSVVPEPSAVLLTGGLAGLCTLRRRARRQAN